MDYAQIYNQDLFRKEAVHLLGAAANAGSLEVARERLCQRVMQTHTDALGQFFARWSHRALRSRDAMQALVSVLQARSDQLSGFSVAQVLFDLAAGRSRPDLSPGFFAELINWVKGLEGRAPFEYLGEVGTRSPESGPMTGAERSDSLDQIWSRVETSLARFSDGLSEEAVARHMRNREAILSTLGGAGEDWCDWQWQTRHVLTDADVLSRVLPLGDAERAAVVRARKGRLPFGVTPYYLSLLDREGPGDRDRSLRAQVIPPPDYVDFMLEHRHDRATVCDFMLEGDTSPIQHVVRRYPGIVILKPYNTCPQICVYCQRNWEIEEAMSPNALASPESVQAAIDWIGRHPAIQEVLITGGDPLVMTDEQLEDLLGRVAAIPHVRMIRIGTRTPVTLPMRITAELADMLSRFHRVGERQLSVVTHVQHPYEVTPEMAQAVEVLQQSGIGVYNQLVYTFFVSRRFETACLRMLLRRVGIEPYYTFAAKGKEELKGYRVPLARMLQEQKEEARLIPGLSRTDEPVYNVPGLGKNYLRARQHRDLLAVLPDGSRVYEFHPWEKNISPCNTFVATDVSILDYLQRLEGIGENPEEYSSILYYI